MINKTKDLTDSFDLATTTLTDKVMWLIPNLIIAILVILVGWMIAVILGQVVERILEKLKINNAVKEIGLDRALSDLHLGSNVAGFVGGVVKWFFAIVAFLMAADIMQLTQVTVFLNDVLAYIPNIIAAILILALGILMANVFDKFIHKSAKVSGFMSPDILGGITKWTVLILSVLAALEQLGIAPTLIDRLLTGIVMMISLAGGLAFGLGGKDKAKEVLDRIGK